ncbi:MAG: RNA-binding domain-containing protein, partial [Acidimicrobiales bacterium]
MDRAEVESLLGDMRRSGRDTLRVEAKRARGGMPMTLHETFSAFANGDGGVVLLGVDERTAFS